jgi:uncharacterized protein (TIGR03067 family)
MRRSILLLAGICCIALLAADAKEDAAKKELTKFEGLWLLDEAEYNSRVSGPVSGEEAVFIEGSEVEWVNRKGEKRGGAKAKITSIDPSKSPKEISFRYTRGSNIGKTMVGIYKLDGNKLEVATSAPDSDKRPSKYTTKLAAGAARADVVRRWIRAKE